MPKPRMSTRSIESRDWTVLQNRLKPSRGVDVAVCPLLWMTTIMIGDVVVLAAAVASCGAFFGHVVCVLLESNSRSRFLSLPISSIRPAACLLCGGGIEDRDYILWCPHRHNTTWTYTAINCDNKHNTHKDDRDNGDKDGKDNSNVDGKWK